MGSLFASLILAVLLAAALLGAVVLLLFRLRKTAEAKMELEGEERRMFGFLHFLGQAIEDDYSSRKLFRVIVDGLEEVLGAEGAALYIVSPDGESLVPAFLAEQCPPLFVLSAREEEEIGNDEKRLASYLRLAKVPEDDGMLWECLRASTSRWLTDLRAYPGIEVDEVMLAPVTHAGRELGVIAAVGRQRQHAFNANDYEVFRSLAEQSSFALGNMIIHQEVAEKRELERELKMASEVQRVLLPAADPESSGFRIHGTNVPARIVSGDYYDYIALSERRLGVAIADVSGKGVPAGLLMATCRSALRSLAGNFDSPAKALAAVNRQLFPDMREDMFISMVYLILEDDSDRLRFARAGHEAPLMFRQATGEVEVLKPGGLAIGIDEGAVFERVTLDFETKFHHGDCLLLYTDGVNEAEDLSGSEFGKERLREIFRQAAPRGAQRVVDELQKELERFVGEHRQMDDITMIAIEKK
jgi:sigma-B regulation protein RsbU (phosphoserine phosphatase)